MHYPGLKQEGRGFRQGKIVPVIRRISLNEQVFCRKSNLRRIKKAIFLWMAFLIFSNGD